MSAMFLMDDVAAKVYMALGAAPEIVRILSTDLSGYEQVMVESRLAGINQPMLWPLSYEAADGLSETELYEAYCHARDTTRHKRAGHRAGEPGSAEAR